MSKSMTEVPVPNAKDIDLLNPNTESFDQLVAARQSYTEQINTLKVQIAELNLKIGAVLDLNQLKSVVWNDEYIVSRKEPTAPRETLDRGKLIDLGVAPSIIKAATKYGKAGSPSIMVRKIKGGEEGVENEDVFN